MRFCQKAGGELKNAVVCQKSGGRGDNRIGEGRRNGRTAKHPQNENFSPKSSKLSSTELSLKGTQCSTNGSDNLGGDNLTDIRLFPIPANQKFEGISDFLEYLGKGGYDLDTKKKVEGQRKRKDKHSLTILAAITERSKAGLVEELRNHDFEVIGTFGEVYHLKGVVKGSLTDEEDEEDSEDEGEDDEENEDGHQDTTELSGTSHFECYMVSDEANGVVLFLTNSRRTIEIKTIEKFIDKDRKSHYLFFPPRFLKEALDAILSEHEDMQIADFTGRRYVNSRQPSEIRPKISRTRTISYWGDDGRLSLREMEHLYGIVAQHAKIIIPDICQFELNCKGFMAFDWGAIDLPLRIFSNLVEKSRIARKAYDKYTQRLVSVGTTNHAFEIGVSTPVSIQLKKPIDYGDVFEFQQRLAEKGYTVVDSFAREGSLYLSSDIVSKNGHSFKIRSDGNSIHMFPRNGNSLQGFMQFYQFIVERIDPGAELSL